MNETPYQAAWQDGYDEGFDAGQQSMVRDYEPDLEEMREALQQARDREHVLELRCKRLEDLAKKAGVLEWVVAEVSLGRN